ncbi:hypothetical protein GGR95_003059 [Sulfitobacter undariae]|uniref:Tat pathway signal sequence domain protein n=1 Tax=Sulfitobacter undariae TaxID=1563671 RepID=A0A7W6H230_9RHOB|nr:hypothetical protein [Sulfitobacter undariae]MBB3995403.1 hypothetical protein [Sulfitobacter undariae]
MKRLGIISIVPLIAATLGAPLAAQENDMAGKISVELNAAQTADNSCQLTFMITNGLATQIDKVVYETVLFEKSGQVNRLALFDFGTLPPARPRVRQLVLPQITCEQLSRVLFNGANTCDGEGLAEGVCANSFTPSSRTDIEVLG